MRRKGGEREDCADSAVEAKYDIDTTGISCTQRGIGIIKRKDGSMHNVLIIDYTEQIFNDLWKESILLEIKAVGTGDKKCGSCIHRSVQPQSYPCASCKGFNLRRQKSTQTKDAR